MCAAHKRQVHADGGTLVCPGGGVGGQQTGPTTERVEEMFWGDANAPAPGGGDGCTTS